MSARRARGGAGVVVETAGGWLLGYRAGGAADVMFVPLPAWGSRALRGRVRERLVAGVRGRCARCGAVRGVPASVKRGERAGELMDFALPHEPGCALGDVALARLRDRDLRGAPLPPPGDTALLQARLRELAEVREKR